MTGAKTGGRRFTWDRGIEMKTETCKDMRCLTVTVSPQERETKAKPKEKQPCCLRKKLTVWFFFLLFFWGLLTQTRICQELRLRSHIFILKSVDYPRVLFMSLSINVLSATDESHSTSVLVCKTDITKAKLHTSAARVCQNGDFWFIFWWLHSYRNEYRNLTPFLWQASWEVHLSP